MIIATDLQAVIRRHHYSAESTASLFLLLSSEFNCEVETKVYGLLTGDLHHAQIIKTVEEHGSATIYASTVEILIVPVMPKKADIRSIIKRLRETELNFED